MPSTSRKPVTLSQNVAGSAATPYADTTGALLTVLRDRANLTGVLAFYVGGTLYYLVFYQTVLIPRWLSLWGFVGTGLGFVAALLVLFRAAGSMSAIQVGLNVPMGLNEIVLAVWLMVRGFGVPKPVKRHVDAIGPSRPQALEPTIER